MNKLAMNKENYAAEAKKASVMDRVRNYFRENAETIIDTMSLVNGNYSAYVSYRRARA